MQFRVLMSYHYFKDTDLDMLFSKHFPDCHLDVFVDSGAFSGMTQGVPIDIEDYARWIYRWKHWFSVYANLDVIKNAERTWENQQRLEDKGLNPISVFHVLEDFLPGIYTVPERSLISPFDHSTSIAG